MTPLKIFSEQEWVQETALEAASKMRWMLKASIRDYALFKSKLLALVVEAYQEGKKKGGQP